ncbi:hypothetical protein [uncultured Fusobacterium sp.]|uniref:hypothetical protein n=1 Tax=uncultured Fusobacterium sp. TaxID=159267 RepID=UPI0015A63924|nr:hypothetical protein [uncultured Fusobacterium sp.]
MDITKNVSNQEIVDGNSKKIYKIYDYVRKDTIFEGTFKEYKDYVISYWEETKKELDEKYFKEKLENDYLIAINYVKESKSFIDLFDKLEYENINVFGDCVKLEIKD